MKCQISKHRWVERVNKPGAYRCNICKEDFPCPERDCGHVDCVDHRWGSDHPPLCFHCRKKINGIEGDIVVKAENAVKFRMFNVQVDRKTKAVCLACVGSASEIVLTPKYFDVKTGDMTNTAADAPMGTDKTASGKSGPTTTKKKKKGGGRLPPALVTRREELVLGLFKGDGQSPLGYALGPDLSVAHANDHLSHVRFDLDPATFDPNYQGLRMNNKRLYELRGIAQQKIKGGYTGPTKENGPVTMTQANRSTVEATGEPIVLKLIGGETPKDFLGRLFSKLASSGLANLRLGSCEGDYAVITPQ